MFPRGPVAAYRAEMLGAAERVVGRVVLECGGGGGVIPQTVEHRRVRLHLRWGHRRHKAPLQVQPWKEVKTLTVMPTTTKPFIVKQVTVVLNTSSSKIFIRYS